jgi:hypothetical protein
MEYKGDFTGLMSKGYQKIPTVTTYRINQSTALKVGPIAAWAAADVSHPPTE